MRLLVFIVVFFFSFEAHAQLVKGWNDNVKLWAARSVLGEVGWDRPGEWGAVLWVYQTRVQQTKRYTFYQMIRQYSAATKGGNHHRNPWLFQLGMDMTRPRDWPMKNGSGPRWKGLHAEAWIRTLKFVDRWQSGDVPNPCVDKRGNVANHFGGHIDRHRAEALRWTRMKCNNTKHRRFRNYFYDSTQTHPKRRYVRPRGF